MKPTSRRGLLVLDLVGVQIDYYDRMDSEGFFVVGVRICCDGCMNTMLSCRPICLFYAFLYILSAVFSSSVQCFVRGYL